jgi:hypothetical protein
VVDFIGFQQNATSAALTLLVGFMIALHKAVRPRGGDCRASAIIY